MLLTFVSVGKLMCMYRIARQKHELALDTYLPTLPVFPGVSSNLPVFRLEHQISQEMPSVTFFIIFSPISFFSRGRKGK